MSNRKYGISELESEIHAKLDELAATGQVWHSRWIAQEISASHRDGLSWDLDSFDVAHFEFCSYTLLQKHATACIGKRAAPEEDMAYNPKQLVLHGFTRVHLQDYYVVDRDDEPGIGVPVNELTDAEIEAKASYYMKLSKANGEHALELLRYKTWRRHQKPVFPGDGLYDGASP